MLGEYASLRLEEHHESTMNMSASSRGSKAAASLIRSSRYPRVCSDCIATIKPSQRRHAATAAVLKTSEGTSTLPHISSIPPVTSTNLEPEHQIKAGVVLSRPPLLTRSLAPFENAYFFYQRRLNERLVMPFTRYFYFKPDTPADIEWKEKAKLRNGSPARDLGGYQAYSSEAWNDELLVGDKLSSPETIVDSLLKDAEIKGPDGEVEGRPDRPLERRTEADKERDQKRLDRKLERTLYLAVQREGGGWGFPSATLIGRENLHQAAERVLVQAAGVNMNTWVVGHVPVGHHVIKPFHDAEKKTTRAGEKTFFMKARIMAGQADLSANAFGLKDFKWLTKEELEKVLGPKYFSSIRNLLADR